MRASYLYSSNVMWVVLNRQSPTKIPHMRIFHTIYHSSLREPYCIVTHFSLVGYFQWIFEIHILQQQRSMWLNGSWCEKRARQTSTCGRLFFAVVSCTNVVKTHKVTWMMIMIIEIIIINKHKCIRIRHIVVVVACLNNTHLSWTNI